MFCGIAWGFMWLLLVSDARAAQEDAPAPIAAATDYDTLLRTQAFFKKIVWTTDTSFAPYEIVIQKQPVPEAGYENSVANAFGAWLTQMAKIFEEKIALPAKLPPGTDPRPIRLIVLLSEGDFVNFQKSLHTWDGADEFTFYDDRIRAVVTYWGAPATLRVRRYAVLRSFVLALLHQRSSAFEGKQPPLWLRIGLGCALAWHNGDDLQKAFANPQLDPQLSNVLVGLSQDLEKQNRFLLPLETLAGVTSYAGLRKHALDEARGGGKPFSDDDPWYSAYYCESALWVAYLRREGAAQHNGAFNTFLRAAMGGAGSPAELHKALAVQDFSDLDRELFRWIYARVREAKRGTPDDARLATLFKKDAKPGLAAEGAAAAAKAAKEMPIAERLALPAADAQIERALALREAARGDIEAALKRLAQSLEKGGGDQAMAGLRQEIERLDAWKCARDAWIAELVASGARFQIERDGKPLTRKVTANADGVLTLESNQGKEQLAITKLAPGALAIQMKGTPAGAPEWVRAYAWVLCGDPRWEKQLKDKSPASLALRKDAEGTYLELRLLGLAVEHLSALAASAEPADEVAAQAVLDRLRVVRQELPTQALILERIEALRALGMRAAGVLYDRTKPKPVFAGKTTWVDDSTVEIKYDFDSAAELDDWVQAPIIPAKTHLEFEPLKLAESLRSFGWRAGSWAGRGSVVLTHAFPFEAPMQLLVQIRHGVAEDPNEGIGFFIVGLCSNGPYNVIECAESGTTYIEDTSTRMSVRHETSNNESAPLGEAIRLEIAHDGKNVRFVHFQTSEPDLPTGSLRSGEVFLMSHTERELIVDSIVIRGKLGPGAQPILRARWIERKARETGLY